MMGLGELVWEIVNLLGKYFDVNLSDDAICDLIVSAVYDFIGDIELDINEWKE